MVMSFLFNIKNDPAWNPGTMFFYNGSINAVQGVHNMEELKYITTVYNETHVRALRTYVWDARVAPVYIRVFGVLQPGAKEEALNHELFRLKKMAEQYNEIYGNPKKYKAQVSTVVRAQPDRTSEVLGYTEIGTTYDVSDCVTACDWEWAKINFNGKTGWTAMGDILGNQYGERLK